MPFDLSTARPVDAAQPTGLRAPGKFDLSTAKPATEEAASADTPGINPLVGLGELALTGTTSLLANVPAAAAYAGGAVARALGADVDPAELQQRTHEYFTHAPRTQSAQIMGRAGDEVVAGLLRPVAEPVARTYKAATEAVSQRSPFAGELMRAAPGALQAATAIMAPVSGATAGLSRVAAMPATSGVPSTLQATRNLVRPAAAAQSARPAPRPAPSTEELKTAAQRAYQQAKEAGAVAAPESYARMATRLRESLREEGFNPRLHPKAGAVIDEIERTATGPVSFDDLEILRRQALAAERSIEPDERRIASIIVDRLDDYADALSNGLEPIVAGNAQAAVAARKQARNLYARSRKAMDIQELIERANMRASQFSGSGLENALRTEFRQLAMNPKRMRRFTQDEQNAIKAVAFGTTTSNILRQIGKLAPTGGLSQWLGIGATMVNPLAATVPLTGAAARLGATRLTKRAAQRAEELMRRGPPGSVDPSRVMTAERAASQTATAAAPRGPIAALPAPQVIVTPQGAAATESALRDIGLTADVIRAGAVHPAASRQASLMTIAQNRPLALPAPGQIAIPLSNDEIQAARAAAQVGLTPDVARAGAAHPGAPRPAAPPPPRAPLALPAPVREPFVVDPAGRVSRGAEPLERFRAESGLDELAGARVRQPGMREAPEREAAAAIMRRPIEVSGTELGNPNQPIAALKKNAAVFARLKFADKTVTNAFDGAQIRIPWSSIKHALSGPVSRHAALAVAKLDDILRSGRLVESQADRSGRQTIRAVHHYDTDTVIAGQPVTIRSIVREHRDGRRYYDHFELRAGGSGEGPATGGLQMPVQLAGGAIPTGQAPGLPQSTTPPAFGEHITLQGRDVSRRFAPIEHIEVR